MEQREAHQVQALQRLTDRCRVTQQVFDREVAVLYIRVWRDAVIATRLHKVVHRACQRDKRRKREEHAEAIAEAEEHRDYKEVWVKGRLLAGTGLGPKRRVYGPPDAEAITDSEWNEWMIGLYDAQQVTHPTPLIPCTQWTGEPMPFVSKKTLKRCFLKQKNGRVTREGSMPAEVWKILYSYSKNVPDLIQKGPLNTIRHSAYPPFKWCMQALWPIDKKNGKPKCKSKRPVACVCPFPRAYTKAMLNKRLLPMQMHDYGAIRGRRREEAIAVAYNV